MNIRKRWSECGSGAQQNQDAVLALQYSGPQISQGGMFVLMNQSVVRSTLTHTADASVHRHRHWTGAQAQYPLRILNHMVWSE
jgi:hypothetical protein